MQCCSNRKVVALKAVHLCNADISPLRLDEVHAHIDWLMQKKIAESRRWLRPCA